MTSSLKFRAKLISLYALRHARHPWKKSRAPRPRETWLAFRPGEDRTFKDNFVSRKEDMELCSVLNDEHDLLKNAFDCGAILVWYHANQAPTDPCPQG